MFEYVGPLPRASPSPTLWSVLAGPTLALVWLALVRLVPRRSPADRPTRGWSTAGGVVGIALAAIASGAHAALLLARPSGDRVRLDHPLSGARLAGLEGPLDLRLDTTTAAACGLACVVAALAAVRLLRGSDRDRGAARWAWLQLALLGALVSVLADGLLTTVLGWGLAGAAMAWLAGWLDPRAGLSAAPRPLGALLGLSIAATILFWGLGGGWDDAGFGEDTPPAVAAVRTAGDPGEATLSMARPPEALVTLDDARHPSLRAPFFRAPVQPGRHVLRIEGGGDDGRSTAVAVASGDDVELLPVGPALSLHAAAAQLALHEQGEPVLRAALESRAVPGGVAVVAATLLALLGAVAAMGAVEVPLGAPGALLAMASVLSVLPAYLLVRAAFLFESAPRAALLVATVGAALVLRATWTALPHAGLTRGIAFASAAPCGLAMVALGLAGTTAGLVAMAVCVLGAAAMHLASAGSPLVVPVDLLRSGPHREPLAVRLVDAVAALLTSMDERVLGASAAAVAGAARIAAWLVAMADEHVLASPADRVAIGVTRGARLVGAQTGSLARVAWGLVAAAGIAVLVHALWGGS